MEEKEAVRKRRWDQFLMTSRTNKQRKILKMTNKISEIKRLFSKVKNNNERLKPEMHSYFSSSSYRTGSTDIPGPLSPLLPIVHRPRLVFRTTSRILT